MHYATFAFLKEQIYKFFFPAGEKLLAHWVDGADFPPLEPRKATLLAQSFIDSHLPNSGLSLCSIILIKAWGPLPLDCYWYYSIKYAIPDLVEFNDSELVEIPVLMDGRIPKYVLVSSYSDPVPRPPDA
jgi:hypothetical protein